MSDESKDKDLIREAGDKNQPTAKLSPADKERQRKIDELRDLELEDAIERAAKRRTTKADRKAKEKAYQDALAADLVQRDIRAEACTHKKGGKVGLSGGMQALTAGNSADYSVIKHTMPNGDLTVICQRCPKEWTKPDPALARSKDAEVRAKYKEDLKEYLWACRLPTDNEPSGTHMFLIQKQAA